MTITADKPRERDGVLFDYLERAFLVVLAAGAVARLAPDFATMPQAPLLLMSECLAIAFIVLRGPARRTDRSAFSAGIALLGTAAPLLIIAPGGGIIPPAVGFWIMVAGLVLNISAKIALNRSFGLAAANRGIKRAGPYRILRHPMYAGYVTTQAAFLLLNPCVWNLCVYGLAWTLQLLRIRAEERLLLEDPEYRAYADKVRFRLIPGVY